MIRIEVGGILWLFENVQSRVGEDHTFAMKLPLYQPLSALTTETPLVSVIMFCRNRVHLIRRAIDSILKQSYPHWELIIQDGASTDGTKEVIESYSDPRIKLVSEPDDGPFDAMWRAYKRCQGEITGSCLSDEELLEHALEEGVNYFLCNPETAAVGRDLFLINQDGTQICRCDSSEFNFLDYLSLHSLFAIQAVLFRRDALLDLGLLTRQWRIDCADFELLTRLAEKYRIDRYPGTVGKYCQQHEGQLSTTPEIGFFCAVGQLRFIDHHFRTNSLINLLGSYPLREAFGLIKRLYQSKGAKELESKLDACFDSFHVRDTEQFLETAQQAIGIGKLHLAQRILMGIKESPVDGVSAKRLIAEILDCLFQPKEAMESWRALGELGVPGAVERSLISQLRVFGVNSKQILGNQKKWASRLAQIPQAGMLVVGPTDQKRLRLAFHSADWSSVEIRHQILPILTYLDPTQFETTCYASPQSSLPLVPESIHVEQLENNSSEGFIKRIREGQIDILIELSGLNPGNQYSAMAARCAPVQIAYLGHMATTGLRQIDYLIADEWICPPILRDLHTEKIIRLPQCYTCFDIPRLGLANGISEPRRLDSRFTFGCFASTSLMNREMLECWARILVLAPHSRLLIASPELSASDCRSSLQEFFRIYKFPRECLLFLPRLPGQIPPHLTAQIDLYLDTFPHGDPYGVACCLSRGIPSISVSGETMASRLGSSLLINAGMQDYIVRNFSEYVNLATSLSRHPQDLQRWKTTLPTQLFESGLTNVPRFAKQFQEVLKGAFKSVP